MSQPFEENRKIAGDGITELKRGFAKMTRVYDRDFTDSRRLLTGCGS